MKSFAYIFIAVITSFSWAQPVVTEEERFSKLVEETLNAFYEDYANSTDYDSIMKSFNYDANDIPSFSDEVYCARLEKMDNMSTFNFECNQPSLDIVKLFVDKRRNFARVVMGRSALYFDMFEETLDKYDMPIELKYLAVIESGLRPQVRSHAGALGLWQFMYRTGLYYGLEENTYIDERMDPVLSTDAACRYLKKLYEIYNDWNMALAAYNAGPGNVNKAIRRSGGKTTYWEVRPFLPKETQGYVPNFIGAAYLMTYHKEHNIVPAPAKLHNAQLDTFCVREGLYMAKISELIGWDIEEIKELNPIYKKAYIPKTTPPQCISGPHQIIGKLVSVEEQLYAKPVPIVVVDTVAKDPIMKDSATIANTEVGKIIRIDKEPQVFHIVKRGETLGGIASKYEVTIEELKKWNNLTSSNLLVGQKLKINKSEENVVTNPNPTPVVKEKPKPVVKNYTVRNGDNFTTIARRHGLTPTQLKKLNPKVDVDRLKIGQVLRVK
jgi:membrane-bound lytic murein transglycosylase D